MFKLALNAGHGLKTPGKRCLKSIDPNETREWVLNSRICDKIEAILKDYPEIEVLRIDDRTGVTDIPLKTRTDKANKWGADFWLGVHHNAGVVGGSGGGTMVFTYTKVDKATQAYQKDIYNAVIANTGLKGNRSVPLGKQDLHECRETKMPACLIECGFMDSTTDTPIILTDEFAAKTAHAIADVIIAHAGTQLREANNLPEVKTPVPVAPVVVANHIHYQVWDDVKNKWLDNVIDNTDYAGWPGHDVCAVYANLDIGNIYVAVGIKNGRWLPEVTNRSDYAGMFNQPIDRIKIRTDTGRKIWYQARLRRSQEWLKPVSGCNVKDSQNGYAGIVGQEIDGLRIWFA